jgi:hypothetical protein
MTKHRKKKHKKSATTTNANKTSTNWLLEELRNENKEVEEEFKRALIKGFIAAGVPLEEIPRIEILTESNPLTPVFRDLNKRREKYLKENIQTDE